jgi:hypothetical protein
VHAVVVGCGTWGTVFAGLLRDYGHEVELACRDTEHAAAIREDGRNPRYATNVDLRGISAAAAADAQISPDGTGETLVSTDLKASFLDPFSRDGRDSSLWHEIVQGTGVAVDQVNGRRDLVRRGRDARRAVQQHRGTLRFANARCQATSTCRSTTRR